MHWDLQGSTPTPTFQLEAKDTVNQIRKIKEEENGWIDELAAQLRLVGLTRGNVVDRTVSLLMEAGVQEHQVWSYMHKYNQKLFYPIIHLELQCGCWAAALLVYADSINRGLSHWLFTEMLLHT